MATTNSMPLSVRLPLPLIAQVKAAAGRRGSSAFIKAAIEAYLDKSPQPGGYTNAVCPVCGRYCTWECRGMQEDHHNLSDCCHVDITHAARMGPVGSRTEG